MGWPPKLLIISVTFFIFAYGFSEYALEPNALWAIMAEDRFWDSPIETGQIPADGESFDCIVVGGGPGGAAAASYLAMEGKSVLLVITLPALGQRLQNDRRT